MIGNLITTIAGYLLAANGQINWLVFIAVTIGTALIISSACVINNVLDQDIDSKMERTKSRPLITGEADPKIATIFGIIIGLLGLLILIYLTNLLVVGIGIIGFVVYVWFYGALSKRKSIHGTLVGSVSGATPILAGYVAARGHIDLGAIIVFSILFIWQMAEFYSIAIFRKKEYAHAYVPVISVIKGKNYTKRSIIIWVILFITASLALTLYNYSGYIYFFIMSTLTLYWLFVGLSEKQHDNIDAWSRRMFKISLVVLVTFCLIISVEHILP